MAPISSLFVVNLALLSKLYNLCLTSYSQRFIRGYASLKAPLHSLLQKDALCWNSNTLLAFEKLRQAITPAPVFSSPDFTMPFELETDAPGVGVGAILSQQGHPIVFFSKKLSPRLQDKYAYVREMYAVSKFSHYLVGHHFIILTDH